MTLKHRKAFSHFCSLSGSVDGRISQGKILWRVVLVQGGPELLRACPSTSGKWRSEHLAEHYHKRVHLVTSDSLLLTSFLGCRVSPHHPDFTQEPEWTVHILSCAAMIYKSHLTFAIDFSLGHLDITEFLTWLACSEFTWLTQCVFLKSQ